MGKILLHVMVVEGVQKEWQLLVECLELPALRAKGVETALAFDRDSHQVLVMNRNSLMALSGSKLAHSAQGLPLGDKVSEGLYVVGAVFGRWTHLAKHVLHRVLLHRLFHVVLDRLPLELLDFFPRIWFSSDRIYVDAFDEEKSDHPVPNSFHLHKLIRVDLIT